MKKNIITAVGIAVSGLLSAQYMTVGQEKVSLQDFKKENLYSLQNSGVEKTIKTVQDFMLLQQFAAEKKADTLGYMRTRLAQREKELREASFFPKPMMNSLLQDYVKACQTERNVLFFVVNKTADDKTDYQKVYNDVVSGKVSMEDAIKTYAKTEMKPMYIKPGLVDDRVFNDLVNAKPGGYTQLYNNSSKVTFAKLINTRPSLGYMVFGTISYPDDENASKMKNDIYAALKSGKKFREVAAEYGTTENEKKNGGAVLGSPTLPDNVYDVLKGKPTGYYSDPILIDGKYFIFNIYDLVPYQINEKSENLFKREMLNSNYGDILTKKFAESLKKTSGHKETADYAKIRNSFAGYNAFTNSNAVLYSYNGHQMTFGALKKQLDDKLKDVKAIPDDQWKEFMDYGNLQFLMGAYSQDFTSIPEIKAELDNFKKNLYSEYVFVEYLKKETEAHPQWLTDYYNSHKDKYVWPERAKGRVAILLNDELSKSIQKEIKDPSNWEALKKKYYGKLNDKNQIIVHFEDGFMDKDAEVFSKYGVPFKSGIYTVKVKDRPMVISVDAIVPPQQMTLEEAQDLLYDAVTGEKLQELIAAQRTKTPISVDPTFIKDLEQNFKK